MKTVRAHEVQDAGEKLFGPKLRKLEDAVKVLGDRLREVERKVGSIPVAPLVKVIESGSVLTKVKKG